jgi:hypothetical protein
MEGPGGTPLMVLDRVGEGRVALLLSDHIWLWSRGHDGGGPQGELLRRIAHWTMKEPELEEEDLTARIDHGRLSVVRRSLEAGPPPEIAVTAPDGGVTRHRPEPRGGRAVLELPATQPGVWQASDGRRTAFAAQFQRHEHVFQRSEGRDELKILKHKPHVRVPHPRPPVLVERAQLAAGQRHRTAGSPVEPRAEPE